MSGNDEQVECPLCMEPLEIDDINFFPCTCGYQICRFCWHRIRTDENGLCPACRKAYPEDPAKFNPLTEDELQRIKKERRQKDLQRKQKAAENRKHLANVRVVQRNLVFVVGLSARLADAEVLRKHEYFGKFGKIHKVVINQSTSYAGAQGPSASAYVTYNKPEDALKAIIAANNVHIDGRTLKASLGTTKYCSHFLRGTQCPKTDCMYLHELGEEQASFTKEEMQVGKHQEYEQRLLEQYMNSQNTAHNHATNNKITNSRKKTGSPVTMIQPSQSPPQTTQMPSPPIPPQTNSTPRQNTQAPPSTTNKDAWPSLQSSGGSSKPDRPLTNGSLSPQTDRSPDKNKTDPSNKAPGKHRTQENTEQAQKTQDTSTCAKTEKTPTSLPSPRQQTQQHQNLINNVSNKRKSLGLDGSDNLSLFSSTNGFNGVRNPKPVSQEQPAEVPNTEIPDTIPVSSATDWQEAFGFGQSSSTSSCNDWQDDDLGFDPLEESSRGLADLLEKENGQKNSYMYESQKFAIPHSRQMHNHLSHSLPPDVLSSRMMGFMTPQQPVYPDMFSDLLAPHKDTPQQNHTQSDSFNMKDWQDGLRALLPNINISFGSQQQQQQQLDSRTQQHNNSQKSSASLPDPHWLKSINQLTDLESTSRRLPFVQQFPVRNTVWPPQTHNPPPGFQSHIRPPLQKTDPHTLAEGLQ